jgi:hypothetical protein
MPTDELIVLIPGSARVARGSQRERFVKGIVETSERPIVERDEAGETSPIAVRLNARSASEVRRLDIVEAYWNDLVPSLQNAGPGAKFLRGTSLIFYWGLSKVWRGFHNRIYLTLGVISAGIALITWYYGTMAMFLEAYLQGQSSTPGVRETASGVLWFLQTIGTWKIWATTSIIMTLIPVNVLIEMMDLTKRFLTNERTEGDSTGLRVQVRHRVREQILAAMKTGQYQRLTIVGHSFGTVIAMDVLGDLPLPALDVRLITIGSPIELLRKRADWLEQEMRKCLARPDLTEWIDIYSEEDWFASGSELPKGSELHAGKSRAIVVHVGGTFVDKIAGRTHRGYFDQDEVVATVLEAPTGTSSTSPGS